MRCQFCNRKITEAQLRGKRGGRCAICTPKGVMPIKPKTKAEKPKKAKAEPKAKKIKKTKIEQPKIDFPTTITDLNTMKKKELVALAEDLGSSSKGLKDELIKRIAKKLKIKPRR